VLNFINVLQAAFAPADPKSAKKSYNLTVFFVLLGSASIKVVLKTLMKLTLGDCGLIFFNILNFFFLPPFLKAVKEMERWKLFISIAETGNSIAN
jgi:hypothetical protein